MIVTVISISPTKSPNRQISSLILCGRTNRRSDLESLVPAALDALMSIQPGEVVSVSG